MTDELNCWFSDPAIDPGGRIDPPILSNSPLLDLKIQPRIYPYLAEDESGDFIVDTTVSAASFHERHNSILAMPDFRFLAHQ